MARARRKHRGTSASAGKSAPKQPRQAQPPPGQVGRRPSRPGFLLVVGLMWIVVGVIELFTLDASWRFVPAIVFVGIGLFFVRGAAATVNRREGDPSA